MSSITESDDSRITTAVGIDKDKNSQSAVKWAIEKLRLKNNRLILVHVKVQQTADPCTYSYSDLCVSSRISIQWDDPKKKIVFYDDSCNNWRWYQWCVNLQLMFPEKAENLLQLKHNSYSFPIAVFVLEKGYIY